MKILAFTDFHHVRGNRKGLEKKAKEADIIVCCGDFTVFGSDTKKELQWMDTLGKKVIVVHGNHENPEEVGRIAAKLKNTVHLHKNTYDAGEAIFVGYGGDGFSLIDREFEDFAAKLSLPSERKIVFVTHQPPHNTKLDYIWDHHGNKSYRKFIVKAKPALMLCGHLHENEGEEDHIGKTRVANPGPDGKFFTV